MQDNPHWLTRFSILAPYAWLVAFFLVPFLIVLKISLSQTAIAQPPYEPVFDLAAGWQGLKGFCRRRFRSTATPRIFADSLYVWSYWKSLQVAAISTAILLLIGYPVAYALARAPRRWQGVLVLLVVLPFWTSFLIRVYAWINILQHDGLLNQALLALRIIDTPVSWLATDHAVYIGIVYSYFPFMVLPLYAALETHGRDAARSRGRSRRAAVAHVRERHGAAVASRHRGGRAALLHPDHRRVRHPGPARLVRDRDDRADAVAGIFRQSRLAGRVRARGRAARAPGDADHDLPAARGARSWKRAE